MSELPLVSVVMPMYDAATYVQESVASVLAQTYPAFELLVVDDGSHDDGPAIVATLAERDARIRLHRQANAGPSAARNLALEHVRGAYVAFLDADDWLHPHKLADQVAALATDHNVDLIYGDVHYVDEQDGTEWDPQRGAPPVPFEQLLTYRNWFAPPAPLLRRRLVDAVGAFDPALRMAEDWDYWLRCLQHTAFRYVPGVVGFYRLHGAQSHRNHEKMTAAHRQLLTKHFSDAPLARRRCLAFRHLADAMTWRAEGAPVRAAGALTQFVLTARTPEELATVWRLARRHPVRIAEYGSPSARGTDA